MKKRGGSNETAVMLNKSFLEKKLLPRDYIIRSVGSSGPS